MESDNLGNNLGKIIEEHRVACMTTNSLKEILKQFQKEDKDPTYNITKLKAHASHSQEDTPIVDDEKYGVVGYLDKRIDSFLIDYKLNFDEDGNEINPIDKKGIETIKKDMDKVGIEDAAVEFLRVLIKDPKIGQLAGVNEDLFHITLISDSVDSDLDRNKIKEHPVNEYLIREYGFKYRILHTKKLIDRKQELTVPKTQHKYIIYWTGNTIYSLKSPKKVARYLKEVHYGEYKLLKRYGVGSEDTLVLLGADR